MDHVQGTPHLAVPVLGSCDRRRRPVSPGLSLDRAGRCPASRRLPARPREGLPGCLRHRPTAPRPPPAVAGPVVPHHGPRQHVLLGFGCSRRPARPRFRDVLLSRGWSALHKRLARRPPLGARAPLPLRLPRAPHTQSSTAASGTAFQPQPAASPHTSLLNKEARHGRDLRQGHCEGPPARTVWTEGSVSPAPEGVSTPPQLQVPPTGPAPAEV